MAALTLQAAHAGAEHTVSAAVEAGAELDTNATRIQPLVIECDAGEGEFCQAGKCHSTRCVGGGICSTGRDCATADDPVTSGLMRMVASGRYMLKVGEAQAISLGLSTGGKLFLSEQARSADELVQRLDASWGLRVADLGQVSVAGAYYDAFQRESLRDFRAGSALLGATIGRQGSAFAVTTHLGYRGFQYKPSPEFNFDSLVGGVELRGTLTSGPPDDSVDWSISCSYALAHRSLNGRVSGPPRRSGDDFLQPELLAGRVDLNHLLHAEVGYLGSAEAALWYGLEVNQSNSYGWSYARHVVGIRFTTRVVWDLFLTVMGALQFSRFQDPFTINTQSSQSTDDIDNENRSRLAIQLSRELTDRWSVILRHSLYVNESNNQGDVPGQARLLAFFRQTLFAGVRFEYGP